MLCHGQIDDKAVRADPGGELFGQKRPSRPSQRVGDLRLEVPDQVPGRRRSEVAELAEEGVTLRAVPFRVDGGRREVCRPLGGQPPVDVVSGERSQRDSEQLGCFPHRRPGSAEPLAEVRPVPDQIRGLDRRRPDAVQVQDQNTQPKRVVLTGLGPREERGDLIPPVRGEQDGPTVGQMDREQFVGDPRQPGLAEPLGGRFGVEDQYQCRHSAQLYQQSVVENDEPVQLGHPVQQVPPLLRSHPPGRHGTNTFRRPVTPGTPRGQQLVHPLFAGLTHRRNVSQHDRRRQWQLLDPVFGPLRVRDPRALPLVELPPRPERSKRQPRHLPPVRIHRPDTIDVGGDEQQHPKLPVPYRKPLVDLFVQPVDLVEPATPLGPHTGHVDPAQPRVIPRKELLARRRQRLPHRPVLDVGQPDRPPTARLHGNRATLTARQRVTFGVRPGLEETPHRLDHRRDSSQDRLRRDIGTAGLESQIRADRGEGVQGAVGQLRHPAAFGRFIPDSPHQGDRTRDGGAGTGKHPAQLATALRARGQVLKVFLDLGQTLHHREVVERYRKQRPMRGIHLSTGGGHRRVELAHVGEGEPRGVPGVITGGHAHRRGQHEEPRERDNPGQVGGPPVLDIDAAEDDRDDVGEIDTGFLACLADKCRQRGLTGIDHPALDRPHTAVTAPDEQHPPFPAYPGDHDRIDSGVLTPKAEVSASPAGAAGRVQWQPAPVQLERDQRGGQALPPLGGRDVRRAVAQLRPCGGDLGGQPGRTQLLGSDIHGSVAPPAHRPRAQGLRHLGTRVIDRSVFPGLPALGDRAQPDQHGDRGDQPGHGHHEGHHSAGQLDDPEQQGRAAGQERPAGRAACLPDETQRAQGTPADHGHHGSEQQKHRCATTEDREPDNHQQRRTEHARQRPNAASLIELPEADQHDPEQDRRPQQRHPRSDQDHAERDGHHAARQQKPAGPRARGQNTGGEPPLEPSEDARQADETSGLRHMGLAPSHQHPHFNEGGRSGGVPAGKRLGGRMPARPAVGRFAAGTPTAAGRPSCVGTPACRPARTRAVGS
ncbi:hypothetical protein GCM10023321_50350 [Pseudonocardia eucalypti]|uniref:Uncharacterized protein n=1 Tax=Pseudonocardia eucalypti TaxID=648755 RepID=A0ABP9QKF9_9PSEU